MKMKTVGAIAIFQLVICFLFVAITALGVVSGQNEVVTDNFGRPVKANAPYLINVPTTPALRRWITQAYSFPTCSDNVFMMTNNLNHMARIPVRFVLPSSSSDDVVRVSTELSIQFTGTYCKNVSGYWSIRSNPYEHVVVTGSRSSNDSTFIIKNVRDRFYSFAFGSADKPTDLALKYTDSRQAMARLALSGGTRFMVSFYPDGSIISGGF
ncbi:hypothetical protein BRARA_K01771 [Brassica rapa]|uniref:Uncharacterized protein n=1 Tax=Brassica campestris TaxID=3711 RepID=A0A397KY40_BRACM|nr:hypothetical protein BRARA_K01771 [Brassica rapa]